MGCCKSERKCFSGKKTKAVCVFYDGELPDFSELKEAECVTIEETVEELYKLIAKEKENTSLEKLGDKCIDYDEAEPDAIKVKEAFLAMEFKICELEQRIKSLEGGTGGAVSGDDNFVTSFSVSPDKKNYIIKLRNGVTLKAPIIGGGGGSGEDNFVTNFRLSGDKTEYIITLHDGTILKAPVVGGGSGDTFTKSFVVSSDGKYYVITLSDNSELKAPVGKGNYIVSFALSADKKDYVLSLKDGSELRAPAGGTGGDNFVTDFELTENKKEYVITMDDGKEYRAPAGGTGKDKFVKAFEMNIEETEYILKLNDDTELKVPIKDSCTGLEKITVGSNSGWRLKGQNPDNYGQIGVNAVDLSTSTQKGEFGAIGEYSIAMGYETKATGDYSTAMGYSTKAKNLSECAVGSFNTEKEGRKFVVGIGGDTPQDGLSVFGDGKVLAPSLEKKLIDSPKSLITKEFFEFNKGVLERVTEVGKTGWRIKGWNPDNYGNIGTSAVDLSISTKKGDFGATGDYSTAMGERTKAIGGGATAMGYTTIAYGAFSTAMGDTTKALGYGSTAMGWLTIATGQYSIVMGVSTKASGEGSTAMGANTKASGDFSTAMGDATEASGEYSTAMGCNTTAPSYCETAIGSFNTTYTPKSTTAWKADDRLFVIGNGDSGVVRSNALIINKRGQIVAPSLTISNIDDAKSLVTKEYVDTRTRSGRSLSLEHTTRVLVTGEVHQGGNTNNLVGEYATQIEVIEEKVEETSYSSTYKYSISIPTTNTFTCLATPIDHSTTIKTLVTQGKVTVWAETKVEAGSKASFSFVIVGN